MFEWHVLFCLQGKSVMHDPFAMRPFVGYNMGSYFDHWLSFGKNPSLKLPRVFHVNWFRKDSKVRHPTPSTPPPPRSPLISLSLSFRASSCGLGSGRTCECWTGS
jgi:hypothetical protein